MNIIALRLANACVQSVKRDGGSASEASSCKTRFHEWTGGALVMHRFSFGHQASVREFVAV